MYHSRFIGTHYDAGFHYGNLLKQNGHSLNNDHILAVSEERKAYTSKTIPIYEKEYPEILEEIRGIADGQEMPFESLASFLLGMYSYTVTNFCTCVALITTDGHTVFGRNSDFLVELEKVYESSFYRQEGSYSFIGNSTAFVEMEDGVNEHGLAVGLTFIYSKEKVPGLNAGMLVRYFLEKCRTVDDCLDALKKLTIGSAQTLTIADRAGNMAVVECNAHETAVITPSAREFICTTNDFNSPQMVKYLCPDVTAEDDMFSRLRYQVAAEALTNQKEYSIEFLKDLLSGKHGFMCQYDRSKGGDTVWSVLYDLTANTVYRCEGNPSRKKYKQDTRLKFV